MVDEKEIEGELGVEDIPDVDPKARKPDKLTPTTRDRIVQALREGAFLTDAAAIGGVTKNAVYVWMRKGRVQKKGKFRDFVNAVDTARAEAKMEASRTIMGAFGRDWKAAAHYLAMTDPDHWGDRKRIDLAGNLDNHVTIEYINDYGKNDVEEANGDGGKI